jgi:hypothetical protein
MFATMSRNGINRKVSSAYLERRQYANHDSCCMLAEIAIAVKMKSSTERSEELTRNS